MFVKYNFTYMDENKRDSEIIELGMGFVYEDGKIKDILNEDSVNKKEWLTHEECWEWVTDSLKKIYDINEDLL